jgi:hypothetical protein
LSRVVRNYDHPISPARALDIHAGNGEARMLEGIKTSPLIEKTILGISRVAAKFALALLWSGADRDRALA